MGTSFPSKKIIHVKETRQNRRHYLHETSFQKIPKIAGKKAKITRKINPQKHQNFCQPNKVHQII
jgi:hypothetical protein